MKVGTKITKPQGGTGLEPEKKNIAESLIFEGTFGRPNDGRFGHATYHFKAQDAYYLILRGLELKQGRFRPCFGLNSNLCTCLRKSQIRLKITIIIQIINNSLQHSYSSILSM